MSPLGRAAALVALVLVWGTQYLVMKRAMVDVPPLMFAALRYGLVAVVAQAVLMARHVPPPSREFNRLRLVYGLSQALGVGLLYWGQARAASSVVGVLTATSPVLVALVAPRFVPEERLEGRVLLASLVGLAGTALLIAGTGTQTPTSLPGVLAVLLATAATTPTKVAARKLTVRLSAFVLLRDMGVLVAVTLALASWLGERDLTVRWTESAVAAVLWLGLVGSAAATGLYLVLLRHVAVARLSYLQFANAAVALGIGVSLGGEPFGVWQGVGAVLILAGGVVVVYRPPVPGLAQP